MIPGSLPWLTALGAAALLMVAAGDRAAAQEPRLRAGAAAVKITPSLDRPVYIAGYANNRVAEAVHDDMWARALVLDDGRTRTAIVVCDLIGLSNPRVRSIRKRVANVPPENVLVASTHVHSGPDTLGLWGKGFTSSGIDPAYMATLEEKVAGAVDQAANALQPVTLTAGMTVVPDGLVHNSREAVQDKELTALRFAGADGKTVATVVHYGAHPEVNKSKTMTSDFVHYVRETVEKRHGGTSLFLNGALGGMVTPKLQSKELDDLVKEFRHAEPEMRRVGEGIGQAALAALEKGEPVSSTSLSLSRKSVTLPLENFGFRALLGAKVLDGELVEGKIPTEVWRLDLGPISWVSIPGEILPKPALELKGKMPGKYRMVLALGNDELGYILDPADYDRPLYKYEKSMSVGKQTWPLLFEAARELLR